MRFTPVSPHHDRGTLDRPPSSIVPTIKPRARAVKRPRSPQAMICRVRNAKKNGGATASLHTNACGLAMMDRAESFQPSAREIAMAKGQMRSNKEKKKPKADKNLTKGGATPSPFSSGKTPSGQSPNSKK